MYLIYCNIDDWDRRISIVEKFVSNDKEKVFQEIFESKDIIEKLLSITEWNRYYLVHDENLRYKYYTIKEREDLFYSTYKGDYKKFFDEVSIWSNNCLHFISQVEDIFELLNVKILNVNVN